MDDDTPELYARYLRGCALVHATPISVEDFAVTMRRYERCNAVLHTYRLKRHRPGFWLTIGGHREIRRFVKMIRNIESERERLLWIRERIIAGSCGDEEGGAGVPAYPVRPRPTLTMSAAKLLPHLDPEPDVREYAA